MFVASLKVSTMAESILGRTYCLVDGKCGFAHYLLLDMAGDLLRDTDYLFRVNQISWGDLAYKWLIMQALEKTIYSTGFAC